MALYAVDSESGIVVECGHGITQTVPVLEGYTITSGIIRAERGGADLTINLMDLLHRRNHLFITSKDHSKRSLNERAILPSSVW